MLGNWLFYAYDHEIIILRLSEQNAMLSVVIAGIMFAVQNPL